jgi:lipid II:glycine glycyltransferase (peptidoglycan interpeptide bridge formation enzyme)
MTTYRVHHDLETWDVLVKRMPDPHILQTREWGEIKAQVGWRPNPLVWFDDENEPVAAALTLQRSVSVAGLPLARVMYVPKGPLLNWEDARLRQRVLTDLQGLAKEKRAIFLKIDPDLQLGTGIPGEDSARKNPLGVSVLGELKSHGWRFSDEQIQYRNTVILDITPTEDELLMNMKQKTRYNVRLAGRRGVEVRTGNLNDLGMLHNMYTETALRDGFAIRDDAYYLNVWRTFMESDMLTPLIAMVEGDPVAALMLFQFARQAWYLHGMSRSAHREKMPNYLLQWEAIKKAKRAGCTRYDLWGAPDVFDEDDPMWGVFRFKDGFQGTVVRHIGAWDLPLRPTLYPIYTQVLPRILAWMRRRGVAQTQARTDID